MGNVASDPQIDNLIDANNIYNSANLDNTLDSHQPDNIIKSHQSDDREYYVRNVHDTPVINNVNNINNSALSKSVLSYSISAIGKYISKQYNRDIYHVELTDFDDFTTEQLKFCKKMNKEMKIIKKRQQQTRQTRQNNKNLFNEISKINNEHLIVELSPNIIKNDDFLNDIKMNGVKWNVTYETKETIYVVRNMVVSCTIDKKITSSKQVIESIKNIDKCVPAYENVELVSSSLNLALKKI